MKAFLIYLSRFAMAFWLGEMLFFITIFAPRVFKVLPRAQAGDLQAALFPAYYGAGLVCAGLLLFSFLARVKLSDQSLPTSKVFLWSIPGLIVLAAGVFAFSLWSTTPELNGLRSAVLGGDLAAQERFQALHKISVGLNGGALFVLLALLALL